jgi:hypothetical protein
MERSWDGGGGEGEHVDLAAHRLDALLVADAESLLLVHDEETEVGEGDVLREDPMRPDQDVDAAVGNRLDDALLLAFRDEAAQHGDPERERGQILGVPLDGGLAVVSERRPPWPMP